MKGIDSDDERDEDGDGDGDEGEGNEDGRGGSQVQEEGKRRPCYARREIFCSVLFFLFLMAFVFSGDFQGSHSIPRRLPLEHAPLIQIQ